MAGVGKVSYAWKDEDAPKSYATGVSLHSHTNQSKETLNFIADLGNRIAWVKALVEKAENRARANHRIAVDYAASYWTPPLTPRLAFDLESRQIEKLGLEPLVSITDHDSINAPMLLRTLPAVRHIPVSVEWSVPYGGDQSFHLGIHNLPSDDGPRWMKRFEEYTASVPVGCADSASEQRLTEMLAELHALPNVLIVFNHPLWNMYLLGEGYARQEVLRFMKQNGAYMHALELNGLRDWAENRDVEAMARTWNKLLISGGDRHGMEPNANLNLTNAQNFTDFVHEIRYEKKSHVLFMPQYAEPWKHRVLRSTLDVIRDYPEFPQGSRTWDERVFHPDRDGIARPIRELWPDGSAPSYITACIFCVRLLGSRPVSDGLRRAWHANPNLSLVLGD